MNKTARIAGVLALAALAPLAGADVIEIEGYVPGSDNQTGATFEGSLEYLVQSGDTGSLLVTLVNKTPEELGGYLTGFVFNIGSADPGASAVLVESTNASFVGIGPISGAPYGWFNTGAALGGAWAGGGSPKAGLAHDQEDTFRFDIAASDAGSLTASSFIHGPNEYNFVARFRGLDRGDSDMVPVPTPASTALFAVASLLTARRRR